jgi:homocysteine S-methyltransferase
MKDFLEEVSSRVILGDGDFEAALKSEIGSPVPYPEGLNLSNPDAVTAVHGSFLDAGAVVIRTNSLHARASDLAAQGLENRLSELHWQAAQLAKSAARGSGAMVAGAVSQEEHGTPSAYQARVGALLDGGCDLIFFENFTSLDELVMALHVKQSLHHCPVICSLAWNFEADFTVAFRRLEDEGADVLGGPFQTVFPMLPAHSGLPMVFVVSEEANFHPRVFSPEAYAEVAVGINIAGGGILFGGEGITASHCDCAKTAIRELEIP